MASSNVLTLIGIFLSINLSQTSLIGECSDSPCFNNGICHQFPNGRHTCSCQPGWTGPDCAIDIDECSLDNYSACQFNRLCINTQGSFKCSCAYGYMGERCEHKISSIINKRLGTFATPPVPVTTVEGTTQSPPPFTTKAPPTPNAIKTPKPITDEVSTSPQTTLAPPDFSVQPVG